MDYEYIYMHLYAIFIYTIRSQVSYKINLANKLGQHPLYQFKYPFEHWYCWVNPI